MGNSMQLNMTPGVMDQGASDIGTFTGNVEGYRAQLKSEATKALGNLADGAGSEQHGQVMRELDRLIDEHIQGLNQHKSGTVNAVSTAQGTMSRMTTRLGQTAL